MIRALVIVIILALFAGVEAKAGIMHGASPVAGCPMGGALGDGCPEAPAGAVIFPTMLSTPPTNGWTEGSGARQSLNLQPGVTQSYAAIPSWDLPGIHYGVGITTPLASHIDPLTPAGCTAGTGGTCTGSAIPGCTYNSTGYGGTTGYWLHCSFTSAGVTNVDHYNFSLHGCVPIEIDVNSSAVTSVDFDDDYFGNGPNCSIEGPPLPFFVNFSIPTTSQATINMTSISVEGGAETVGLCAAGVTCACYNSDACNEIPSLIIFRSQNPVTFDYSSFLHIPGRLGGPISPGSVTRAEDLHVKHSLFYGFNYSGNGLHGEWFADSWNPNKNLVQANVEYSYNTFIEPANALGNGPAQVVIGNLTSDNVTSTVTNALVSHNIFITNLQDGSNTNWDSASCGNCWGRGNTTVSASVGLSGNAYGTVVYDSNFVDPTGNHFCFYNLSTTVPATPEVLTGNINMLTGAEITKIASTGDPGCTGTH